MKRDRDTASSNEREDIIFIVNSIKSRSDVGLRIINGFHDKFGLEIIDAQERSGNNRGLHYDFDIQIRKEGVLIWVHVEHKGCKENRPIKPDEKPWTAGVQFHNGGCSKYSITRMYAKHHYDIHIGSGTLKTYWNVTADIPSFDDWWSKDCCRQDDPKTPFGIELKQKVRLERGIKGSLLKERAPVIDAMNITEEVKQTLINEVLPIANSVLETKEYWLTIHGILNSGEFHFAWNPKFVIDSIDEVIVLKKKDIWFEFKCSNNFCFKGILRWGKGAGFSCLRIDLR